MWTAESRGPINVNGTTAGICSTSQSSDIWWLKKLETWLPHGLTEEGVTLSVPGDTGASENFASNNQHWSMSQVPYSCMMEFDPMFQLVDGMRSRRSEFLPHPPYSPELTRTDYPMFHQLDRCVRGKQLPNKDALIQGFRNVFDQYDADFCMSLFRSKFGG
ncbi:hypothetical protein TNCV_3535921 [Trichonephila clavipes]|uniref:Transposase n=1 Tax=Trichonephila clavipes TaxID=2585209 RepID=A0A8X6VWD5_TRICX|nr:hypothetical protein TNCV_3535921 [Trichonephila clavipes]